MVRQTYPTHREIPDDALYADLSFPPAPAHRPYVIVNMVSSVDGKIALRGRSRGIGSRLDRAAMLRLRAMADVVLAGAETVRGGEGMLTVSPELSQWRVDRGLSPQPIAATISARLELSPTLAFFRTTERKPIVFTSRTAPAERREQLAAHAQIVDLGEDWVDLAQAVAACARDFGTRLLLVEGGPRLNQQLFDAGLVDELFWTIAPKVFGGAAQRTLVEGPVPSRVPLAALEVVSLYLAENELFTRYRVVR